ncbi:MAG: hypothetical protein IT305_15810 [Chloroflexi bacterium]|nr:hypothetical protein [Chloroflexota bacterium]
MAYAEKSVQRVHDILASAGLPSVLIERDQIVLSGYLVEPRGAGSVLVRWVGRRDVADERYRRTFLDVYAFTLRKRGFRVEPVIEAGTAGLECMARCSAE